MSGTEDEEYEVEKILGKRKRQGGIEYLIKWAGYDNSQNTWEPEENLDCADRIKDFEEKNKAAELAKKEKKTRERKKSTEKRRKRSTRSQKHEISEMPTIHEPKVPPLRITGLKRKHSEEIEEAVEFTDQIRIETNFVEVRKGEFAEMRPNPLDTAGQQFVSQFERLYEAENSEESKSEDESESENIEEDPWSDPAKIGFNRGFEPLKIHESVQDSDDQIYFVVEWKNSKIIDFVKREECNKKCPKLVCEFYEEMMNEMLHEWDGIYDLDSEDEIDKLDQMLTSASISNSLEQEVYLEAGSSGLQEKDSSSGILTKRAFNPKDPLNLEEVDSDSPPTMEKLSPEKMSPTSS